MKWAINKNIKKLLIGIIIILIMVVFFLIYWEIKHPGFEVKKNSLYNYQSKVDIDYQVNFRPNILYDYESLGKDKVYISEYADTINTVFDYEFSGERLAEIKGDYEIVGVMEGFLGEGEKFISLWTKKIVFSPKEEFNSQDKDLNLKKEVAIKLDRYKNFLEDFKKETKILSQVKMSVFMNINLQVNTDEGLIEKTFSPAITFPLDVNYFQIIESEVGEQLGAIEETQRIQFPINKNKIISYVLALGMMILILLCLIFLTVATTKDEFTKELKKIFKKYGGRLVALDDEIITPKDYVSKVKTMDDLVRIADEISQPIIYKYSLKPQEITKFYISDASNMYVFDLKEFFMKTQIEKSSLKKAKKGVKKMEKTQNEKIIG